MRPVSPMTSITSPERQPDEVERTYQERRARFEAERALLARRSRLLSHGRLAAFLVAAGALGYAVWGQAAARGLIAGAGLAALAAFVALVVLHAAVLRREERAATLAAINGEALARHARDWEHAPEPRTAVAPASRPVAVDLDLLGRASLLQLLGAARTPPGRVALVDWLLGPASPEEVRARQAAVGELAPHLDWRQDLEARARLLSDLPPDPGAFLRWCEDAPWLLARPWLVWLPRVLGAVTLALLLLQALGPLRPWWLLLALGNLGLAGLLGRRATETFNQISAREREFASYAELFQQLGAASFECPRLRDLQQQLAAGALSASVELRRLDRLCGLADTRRSGLFHVPLQALVLWDLHVLWLLERWRRRAGREVRRWLALLGEVEALSALAGLRHDHPGWCFPEVTTEGPARLEARGLGHPLLPPASCVVNDVALGPEGTFLLVTGSNMSGKSTLLRAIGVNVVLAQAGGPVCASALRLPPLVLGTSFRVQDSLEAGVSFFLAELRRLKEIVDLAGRCRDGVAAGGPRLLYLLDEILLGTNITERQIAVRRVLAHLLAQGALGAISTHDLTLASAEGVAQACRPVYFRESFEEGPEGARMTFDYKLREGVAPTANALKLLALVGLEE